MKKKKKIMSPRAKAAEKWDSSVYFLSVLFTVSKFSLAPIVMQPRNIHYLEKFKVVRSVTFDAAVSLSKD